MSTSREALTAIILPTYNEIENISRLVVEIDSLVENKVIIIVDDNSPDGTGEEADQLASLHETVRVIHRPGKLGLGTAYTSGIALGMSLQADLFITMDADFSHAPRYIPELIARASNHDLVIGSRYVQGGGTLHFGLHRQILSRGANLLAKTALKLAPRDCTSGFRCYHRHVLETIDPKTIISDGYSFLVEMLFRCIQAGFTVGEVPILFVNRREGVSKISKTEIFKAMATIWRLVRSGNRPGKISDGAR